MAITRKGNIITDTTRGKTYKEVDGKIYSLNKDNSVGKRVGFLLENSLRRKPQTKGATRRLNPSQKKSKQTADILNTVKNIGSFKKSERPPIRTVEEKRSGYDETREKAKIRIAMDEGTTSSTKPRVRTKNKTKNVNTQKVANVNREMSGSENKPRNNIMEASTEKNYNVGISRGGVPFKEAFAHFRKKGADTFMWNDKKYTTELKEETKTKAARGTYVTKKRMGSMDYRKGGLLMSSMDNRKKK
jgi:hypothetical protein